MRISIRKFFLFILYVIIFSIVGWALPQKINLINGLNLEANYGYFASYAVSMILFWIFMYGFDFRTSKKSIIKRLNIKLRKIRYKSSSGNKR